MALIGVVVSLVVVGGIVWGYIVLWASINSHALARYNYEPINWKWIALITGGEVAVLGGSFITEFHNSHDELNAIVGVIIYAVILVFATYRIARKTNLGIALASIFVQAIAAIGSFLFVIVALIYIFTPRKTVVVADD